METEEFLKAAVDTMRTTTAVAGSALSVLFILKWLLILILAIVGFFVLRKIARLLLPVLRYVGLLILELIEKIRRKFGR